MNWEMILCGLILPMGVYTVLMLIMFLISDYFSR